MKQSVRTVGVDPGLVHTGVVQATFYPEHRNLYVDHTVINGPDIAAFSQWLSATVQPGHGPAPLIFVEAYRPRSHFNTDARMVAAVQQFKLLSNVTVLSNTGVKQVVKQPLMELLDVWKFSTVTHHQDLRAAARIMLLGMLKDVGMNRLLTNVVKDHLKGRSWDVRS